MAWILVEDTRLLVQRQDFITAQQAAWASAWCVGSLCSYSRGGEAESWVDAARTGLGCSQRKEGSIMRRSGQGESWIFKIDRYNPNSFPTDDYPEVNQKKKKTKHFSEDSGLQGPNYLTKLYRPGGRRESQIFFNWFFRKTLQMLSNTRALKMVGNVGCPSNTLRVGPFWTSLCDKRHAIFEL